MIAGAASNCENEPWSGSAEGKTVDISPAGESVWTAVTTENHNKREYRWTRGHGTSFAVAIVAGDKSHRVEQPDRPRGHVVEMRRCVHNVELPVAIVRM